MKKYLFSIMCMFVIMFALPAQAESSLIIPAYVAEMNPGPGSSFKAEPISEGKVTAATINYNFEYPSSGTAAVIASSGSSCGSCHQDSSSGSPDSSGVHGGGTIGGIRS